MGEITAAAVGKLRAMTNAGLMDCKKALTEAGGDLEVAVDALRKKGIATAAQKAGRSANEGVIVHYIRPDSRLGVLMEVNCETDFVAKNESFRRFCQDAARAVVEDSSVDLEAMRTAQVAALGENIRLRRRATMEVSGTGLLAAYIHTGARVGVLVEVGAGSEGSIGSEVFRVLVKDITLQIAASNPIAVRRGELDGGLVARERAIAEEQAKGKPAQAVERIIAGKLEKYYQNTCLEDQGFVRRNGEVTVGEHVAGVGRELGDELVVRRFLRFQVGEGE